MRFDSVWSMHRLEARLLPTKIFISGQQCTPKVNAILPIKHPIHIILNILRSILQSCISQWFEVIGNREWANK